jgi:hypothetical protein
MIDEKVLYVEADDLISRRQRRKERLEEEQRILDEIIAGTYLNRFRAAEEERPANILHVYTKTSRVIRASDSPAARSRDVEQLAKLPDWILSPGNPWDPNITGDHVFASQFFKALR